VILNPVNTLPLAVVNAKSSLSVGSIPVSKMSKSKIKQDEQSNEGS